MAVGAAAGSRPGVSCRRRRAFRWVLGLGMLAFVLVSAELMARMVGGYYLFSWRLIDPANESGGKGFFEPNKFKIWNAKYVAQNPQLFADWPTELPTFDDDDVHPHYLFKPNLRVIVEGKTLRPVKDGEKPWWTTNELGMRGPAVGPKPAGVKRVVCLGASTTEGSHDDETTSPHYLQQELDRRHGPGKFQVLNAGHHAYNSGDMTAFLETVIKKIQPDVVLWYECCNDIYWPNWTKNWEEIQREAEGGWTGRKLRKLANHSAIVKYLAKDALRPKPVEHEFVNEPTNASLVQWSNNVNRFVEVCRRHNAQPVICSFCTIIHEGLEWSPDEHPQLDAWITMYQPLTVGEIAAMYGTLNAQGKKIAVQTKCDYIDVAAAVPKTHENFWDGVHFHPAGNQRVAAAMAEGLTPLLYPVDKTKPAAETASGKNKTVK